MNIAMNLAPRIQYRALWITHVDGEWYRCSNDEAHTLRSDDLTRLRTTGRFSHENVLHFEWEPPWLPPWLAIARDKWEHVPFASPLHWTLDYVYVLDEDESLLTILSWYEFEGILTPSARYFDLAKIDVSEIPSIDYPVPPKTQYDFSEHVYESNQAQEKEFEKFEMKFGIPTPMNELRERFFTDLVYVWRYWIDDPSTWRFDSPVFRILSVAFLRLAAWDFEVSFDMTVADSELPISFMSIPSWSYPDKDVYWFHRYLVVLQDELETNAMINQAVSKAKSHIGNTRLDSGNVHLIVISLCHIIFVELSREVALASKKLVLLSSYSSISCSPGFRALSRILTSNCWKKPRDHKEKWPANMPPEIVHMLLHRMEPRDAVAFSQASFTAEECYYASESQLKNTRVDSFESSIPCCHKRIGLETQGICCSQCYVWNHLSCAKLISSSSGNRFLCKRCQERDSTVLDPGGMHRLTYQKNRAGICVRVGDIDGRLTLLFKPGHPQPGIRKHANFVANPPRIVPYATILFNGKLTGLAYDLWDMGLIFSRSR